MSKETSVQLPFPLEQNESVLLLTRRHWLAFWPRFIAILLIAALPAGFGLGLLAHGGLLHGSSGRVYAGLAAVWFGFWFIRMALLKYRYDRDIWVITNRRVVDAYASAPFHFMMSAAPLETIQDISTRVDGLGATVFGYGDIECQTAGETRRFVFRQVPHPRAVATQLQEVCLRAQKGIRAG